MNTYSFTVGFHMHVFRVLEGISLKIGSLEYPQHVLGEKWECYDYLADWLIWVYPSQGEAYSDTSM